MKTSRILPLLLFLLSTLTAAAQPVLQNGSFELGHANAWTYNSPAMTAVLSDTTSPHFLRGRVRAGSAIIARQTPAGLAASGTTWILGGRIRLGGPSTVALNARLTLEFLDPATQAVRAASAQNVELSVGGTSWIYFAVQEKAPASSAVRVTLRAEPFGTQNPATFDVPVDFDDIELRQATVSAGPTVLARPSMLHTDGSFRIGGQPFFPIGALSPGVLPQGMTRDALYAELVASGFNAVQTGSGANGTRRDANVLLKELKAAAQHNLRVNAAAFVNEDGAAYAALETMLRSPWASSLLSWQTTDEPDVKTVDPAAAAPGLSTAYREYARLDGGVRPVMIILSGNPYSAWIGEPGVQPGAIRDDRWQAYHSVSDVLAADVYPVPDHDLANAGKAATSVRALRSQPWQHAAIVLSSGWGTGTWSTPPSFEQARATMYSALIHGAQSIWWYALGHKDDASWNAPVTSALWPRMKELNGEIARLSVPLLRGLREDSVTAEEAAPIQAGSRFRLEYAAIHHPEGNQRRMHLIAANLTPQHANATRSLGTPENPAASVRVEFRLPVHVTSLAEGASNVTWRYDDFDANVTYVTAFFEPLESRTLVFNYSSYGGTVLVP